FVKMVEEKGFSTGYSGIRVSAEGNCFRINATLWNLMSSDGKRKLGQAACFRTVPYL
ncbi:hypothetical protein SARC_06002, partial [Sphaeroforma arctica JP610]